MSGSNTGGYKPGEDGKKIDTSNTSAYSEEIAENNAEMKKVRKVREEGNRQKEQDMKGAQRLSDKIKNRNKSLDSYVLENGNINVTAEVKDRFTNFGEEMGLSAKNPISVLLREIGEHYLSVHEIEIMGFMMIYEYIKYDHNNLKYGGGDKRGERVSNELASLDTNEIGNFIGVYGMVLGKMFGEKTKERFNSELSKIGLNVTEEMEEKIMLNYTFMNILDGNPGAVSAIVSLQRVASSDDFKKYIYYFFNNDLKGSSIWNLFKDNGQDPVKFREYLDSMVV